MHSAGARHYPSNLWTWYSCQEWTISSPYTKKPIFLHFLFTPNYTLLSWIQNKTSIFDTILSLAAGIGSFHFKVSQIIATTEIRVAIYQRPLAALSWLAAKSTKEMHSQHIFVILSHYFPLSVIYKGIFMMSTLTITFGSIVLSSL